MSVSLKNILENLSNYIFEFDTRSRSKSVIQFAKFDSNYERWFMNIKTSLYELLLGDTHEADKLKVANFLVKG